MSNAARQAAGHKRPQNHFAPSLPYMVIARYNRKNEKWSTLSVKQTNRMKVSIESNVIHYGQGVFEGLKAYMCPDDSINVFRIHDSWLRMCKSAHRLHMPEVPQNIFTEAVDLAISKNVLRFPKENALYIRPFLFNSSTESSPGAGNEFIFAVTVKELHTNPDPQMRVWVETRFTRAAMGGAGYAKAAGNYASALMPESLAGNHGCDRTLWLDQTHINIEEFSTMNFFAVSADGLLFTPKPTETVIDGITRKTIISICEEENMTVNVKPFSINELVKALEAKEIVEIFGSGTASNIIPCTSLHHEDYVFDLPLVTPESLSMVLTGKLNQAFRGTAYSEHNWLHRVHHQMVTS